MSNRKEVVQGADISQPLFSSAPPNRDKAFQISIIIQAFPASPGPLPDNLFDQIQYSGQQQWLAMQLGGWGHCQIDLAAGKARAVLAEEFGSWPDLISRYVLNTILTNFMISSGLGLLHTTAVFRDGRILMMLAGHNSGKSTTALHLAMAGYAFVSDSQIYIERVEDGLALYGFPVGRVKLRQDMLAQFPLLQTYLKSEPVRHEMKYRLDLKQVDPFLVHDQVIHPRNINLCLLSRTGSKHSSLSRTDRQTVLDSAMVNSLYYDIPAGWHKNFEQIAYLVGQADCCRLEIGTDPAGIIRAVDELMG